MSNKPKVSIISITYNQEKYIKQALDSFIMQKADFDFEVIVADDCSTDSTQKIINDYAKKYPDIIKPILRKANNGAWNNFIDALSMAKGDYIALCEGDDYWTDENKLQIQVDFLEKNPDYSLCFHPVKVFFENHEHPDYLFPEVTDDFDFSQKSLLKANFIQTNSVVYRKQKYDNLDKNIMPGDWYMHLYHAQFGRIGFINKTMSAYRRHSGGVWFNTKEVWTKYGEGHLNLYRAAEKMYDSPESYEILKNNGADAVYNIAKANIDHFIDDKLITNNPDYVALAIKNFFINEDNQTKLLNKYEANISTLNSDICDLNNLIFIEKSKKEQIEEELNSIKKSKLYHYMYKLRSLKSFLKRRLR